MSGRLYLVATPLGNLADLSQRAADTLRASDLVLCEDTRHTAKLLAAAGIRVPTRSFHQHNEEGKADEILDMVEEGTTVSLVSDAGMPVLSDPGFPLVRRARERGIAVIPIPGPFAAALALVASGIAAVPFTFHGFVPSRQGERRRFWETLRSASVTAVVYESPHRILDSLDDAADVLGDVEITVAREMTKIHEEYLHGTPASVAAELRSRDSVRGEITIVIAPIDETASVEVTDEQLVAELDALRASGVGSSQAMRMLADRYRIDRRELYTRLVR